MKSSRRKISTVHGLCKNLENWTFECWRGYESLNLQYAQCDDEAEQLNVVAAADVVVALPRQHCCSTLVRFDWANQSH